MAKSPEHDSDLWTLSIAGGCVATSTASVDASAAPRILVRSTAVAESAFLTMRSRVARAVLAAAESANGGGWAEGAVADCELSDNASSLTRSRLLLTALRLCCPSLPQPTHPASYPLPRWLPSTSLHSPLPHHQPLPPFPLVTMSAAVAAPVDLGSARILIVEAHCPGTAGGAAKLVAPLLSVATAVGFEVRAMCTGEDGRLGWTLQRAGGIRLDEPSEEWLQKSIAATRTTAPPSAILNVTCC